MYAVIETGGKQVRVHVGDVVHVERVQGDVGTEIVFDQVLLVGGDETKIGAPTVENAAVRGSIVDQGRAKKVLSKTYKKRQNSNRRTIGHRQSYTAVKIESIDG